MPEPASKPAVGSHSWVDLAVPNATEVRAFYESVVGWTSAGLDMGGYEDYMMNEPGTGKTAAGVCHARGSNADLPPAWLVYFVVEDIEASLAACVERGGTIIRPAKNMGPYGRIAVIRDPAGAVCALSEPPK